MKRSIFIIGLLLFFPLSPGEAAEVYRQVEKEGGWSLPQKVMACPVTAKKEITIQGYKLIVLNLDEKCLEKEFVVEDHFVSDGRLLIKPIRYQIFQAAKICFGEKVVMFRFELAPVLYDEETGLLSTAGAINTYFYVAEEENGPFVLRIEKSLGFPELPAWILGVR